MDIFQIILLFLSGLAIYTSMVTEVSSKPIVSRGYFPRGLRFSRPRADSSKTTCMSRDYFGCKPYRYRTLCIPKRSVCDGHKDCPRGDDESCCGCPTLSLENGSVRGNWKKVGSIAMFTCNVGYTEVNSKTSSTCTWGGVWTYKPRCVIDCGNPQNVDNAVISEGLTTFQSTRSYTCVTGHASNGEDSTISCLDSGNWEATAFNCTETTLGARCNLGPCIGTGAFCSDAYPGICVCGPLYRYNTTIRDCQQVCTNITEEFILYDGVYMTGSYKEEDGDSNICKARCLNDMNCMAVEIYIGNYCYYYTFSLEVGEALNLKSQGADYVTYSRQCA